jgi:UDP-glucuronate decarboxylase
MRLDDGRVVSNFIVQALRNRPITVYGNGEQTRSFCYVDDLITGLTRLMDSSDAVTGPVNLGNPAEFTMLELAKLVLELTGSRSRIEFLPLPVDDPEHRRPEIASAKSLLDWEPKMQLREGLGQTIAYFERLLASASGSPVAAE